MANPDYIGGGTVMDIDIRKYLLVAMTALADMAVPPAKGEPNDPAGAEPVDGPAAKCGRNDPCPCGSGKKHKRCCRQLHKAKWPQTETNP